MQLQRCDTARHYDVVAERSTDVVSGDTAVVVLIARRSPPSSVTDAGRIRLHRTLLRLQITGSRRSALSSLLLFVQDVPDHLLFATLLLPAVYAQADAFDQPLGLVAVQSDELVRPTAADVRVERPRLLSVEVGRAQHVVLDESDDAPVDGRSGVQHHCDDGKRRQQKRGRVHRRRGGMHDDIMYEQC
ncbi:unnamed protein product [Aphis gossypii]|uniref:Uncharacterized protein n=1 Tax=Aphis gossypii TaxID=80765 RepID=A0A9P0NHL0_APHGO|nr:unnamed protein product [Aphis gossypii]